MLSLIGNSTVKVSCSRLETELLHKILFIFLLALLLVSWAIKQSPNRQALKTKKSCNAKNGNKMCRLCVTEAAIIMKGKKGQLNQRNEIFNKCRHQNKFLLKNWKEKRKNSSYKKEEKIIKQIVIVLIDFLMTRIT